LSHQRGTIGPVLWFWVVVLVAVIGAIAVVAAGRGDSMVEVYDDRPDSTLPAGRPLNADDLRTVRFNTGVRGYRMDEVDALLARLEAELLVREDHDSYRSLQEGDQSPVGPSDDNAVLDLIRDGPRVDRDPVEHQAVPAGQERVVPEGAESSGEADPGAGGPSDVQTGAEASVHDPDDRGVEATPGAVPDQADDASTDRPSPNSS